MSLYTIRCSTISRLGGKLVAFALYIIECCTGIAKEGSMNTLNCTLPTVVYPKYGLSITQLLRGIMFIATSLK